MASRTLLLVTYHFPPSAAVAVYRMLGFAKYLPKYDWNVVVVAPPRLSDEPVDANLMRLVPRETEVVRVPIPGGFLGKVGWRLVNKLTWAPGALAACHEVIQRRKPDAILTSSPPPCVHYLGMYLQKCFGLPWVASLRDPWITNRVIPMKGSRMWASMMERRVMHSADAVIANTPINLSGLNQAYPHLSHKMAAIPNGFEPAWFPSAPERHDISSTLSLLHAGELYSGRDPRPLFDALAQLDMETSPVTPRWDVRFLGRETDGVCNLNEEMEKRRLQGAQENQVPYEDALRRMVSAHALMLLHTPGSKVGVPAKLYEYLGAGRPILALAEPDGDVAWVLKKSGVLYRLAAPNDIPGILRAARELRDEILKGSDRESRPTHLSPFTRESMARRMAQCLDWAVASKGRSGRTLAAAMREEEFVPAENELTRAA